MPKPPASLNLHPIACIVLIASAFVPQMTSAQDAKPGDKEQTDTSISSGVEAGETKTNAVTKSESSSSPASTPVTEPAAPATNAAKDSSSTKAAEKTKPAKAAAPTKPDQPRVFVDPPTGDADFALMGEYAGEIETEDGVKSQIAVQVAPFGRGEFQAIMHTGGLPGSQGSTADERVLVGRRNGDWLILSGGDFGLMVEHDHCLVISRQGKPLGKLNRVERTSPTMGATPPEGGMILFDGSGVDQFSKAEVTEEGLLREGADVLPLIQDFNLHVEFRIPYMPDSEAQKRGNSGCYLHSRYEVQVLDSFAQKPVFNGCSSLYRFKTPDVNMSLPPLQWQTYDIVFTAARFASDGSKIRNARISVWHNGIKTQNNVELPKQTGHGAPEDTILLPIRFQNHSDPVRYRNIWIVDRGLHVGDFPIPATLQ